MDDKYIQHQSLLFAMYRFPFKHVEQGDYRWKIAFHANSGIFTHVSPCALFSLQCHSYLTKPVKLESVPVTWP